MSIRLREGFADETLERVLEDLAVRFLINCPAEDLSSIERVFFQIEEAHWFYQDFLRALNPLLPRLKMKQFTVKLLERCPDVWQWGDPKDALAKFGKYKSMIPVRGAALFTPKMDKILLVQGTESKSWSFPRGKISKDENDVECAVRETREETGFDSSDLIDDDEYVARTIRGKNYKIYLIKGVPEDTVFEPLVRNEINAIEWRSVKQLAKDVKNGSNKYYLVNSMFKPIMGYIHRMKGTETDEELKRKATLQLKKILGIGEEKKEVVDPGRALLNMLQAKSKENRENGIPPQQAQVTLPQIAAQMPPNMAGFAPPPVPMGMPFAPSFGYPFAMPFFNPYMQFPTAFPLPPTQQPSQPIRPVPATPKMKEIVIGTPEPEFVAPAASSLAKPTFPVNKNSKELLALLKGPDQSVRVLKRGETLDQVRSPQYAPPQGPPPQAALPQGGAAQLLNVLKRPSSTGAGQLLDVLKNSPIPRSQDAQPRQNSAQLLEILKKPAESNGNQLLSILKRPSTETPPSNGADLLKVLKSPPERATSQSNGSQLLNVLNSPQSSGSGSGAELLSILKRPSAPPAAAVASPPAVAPAAALPTAAAALPTTGNPLLDILKGGASTSSPAAAPSSNGNQLLDILKGGSSTASPAPSPSSNGNQLLSILKGGSISAPAPTATATATPPTAPSPAPATGNSLLDILKGGPSAPSSSAGSAQLLSLLKGPSTTPSPSGPSSGAQLLATLKSPQTPDSVEAIHGSVSATPSKSLQDILQSQKQQEIEEIEEEEDEEDSSEQEQEDFDGIDDNEFEEFDELDTVDEEDRSYGRQMKTYVDEDDLYDF